MTFVKDPCGVVCVLVTYMAVLYADYVVTRWIILQTMQNRYIITKYLLLPPNPLQNSNMWITILFSFSFWGPIHVVAFNTIVFMLTMAHLKAVLSDPGTVPLPQSRLDFSDLHSAKKNGMDREEWTVCTRCETYRPPRAHHCRICKRCIR